MPELPTAGQWRQCGVSSPTELHGGQQSRNFDAIIDGRRVAVKLTDRRLADEPVLLARRHAVQAIASVHAEVASPVPVDGELVRPIGGWLATATTFIVGDALDAGDADDALLMGRTLAHLHEAMEALPAHGVPIVPALASRNIENDTSGRQLLHGDFSDKNIIASSEGVRIFDFDDCGYGPVEYDIANSLYMVMFDSEVHERAGRYEAFRPAFLAGYFADTGQSIDTGHVDDMMGARINALGRWLDDLPSAPIGIRISSPEWHDTLRAFIRAHTA